MKVFIKIGIILLIPFSVMLTSCSSTLEKKRIVDSDAVYICFISQVSFPETEGYGNSLDEFKVFPLIANATSNEIAQLNSSIDFDNHFVVSYFRSSIILSRMRMIVKHFLRVRNHGNSSIDSVVEKVLAVYHRTEVIEKGINLIDWKTVDLYSLNKADIGVIEKAEWSNPFSISTVRPSDKYLYTQRYHDENSICLLFAVLNISGIPASELEQTCGFPAEVINKWKIIIQSRNHHLLRTMFSKERLAVDIGRLGFIEHKLVPIKGEAYPNATYYEGVAGEHK